MGLYPLKSLPYYIIIGLYPESKETLRQITEHCRNDHDEDIIDIGTNHGQQYGKHLYKHIGQQNEGSSSERIPEKLLPAMQIRLRENNISGQNESQREADTE